MHTNPHRTFMNVSVSLLQIVNASECALSPKITVWCDMHEDERENVRAGHFAFRSILLHARHLIHASQSVAYGYVVQHDGYIEYTRRHVEGQHVFTTLSRIQRYMLLTRAKRAVESITCEMHAYLDPCRISQRA